MKDQEQENTSFTLFFILFHQLLLKKQKRRYRTKKASNEKCKWMIVPDFHEYQAVRGFPCFLKIFLAGFLSQLHKRSIQASRNILDLNTKKMLIKKKNSKNPLGINNVFWTKTSELPDESLFFFVFENLSFHCPLQFSQHLLTTKFEGKKLLLRF